MLFLFLFHESIVRGCSRYWGKQVSTQNKILIPMHWFKTFFFGRDISRF